MDWVLCRYSYSFPFLDTKGIVVVDDNRVGPLYEHTFPPLLAPSLSFVGIPRKVKNRRQILKDWFSLATNIVLVFEGWFCDVDHSVPFLWIASNMDSSAAVWEKNTTLIPWHDALHWRLLSIKRDCWHPKALHSWACRFWGKHTVITHGMKYIFSGYSTTWERTQSELFQYAYLFLKISPRNSVCKCCFWLQYCDKYGDNVGFPHLEEWRKGLCVSAVLKAMANLETFRDSGDEDELLQVALQSPHFTQFPQSPSQHFTTWFHYNLPIQLKIGLKLMCLLVRLNLI